MAIKTKSNSVSAPETARRRLVTSTDYTMQPFDTACMGTTQGARLLNWGRGSPVALSATLRTAPVAYSWVYN